jgi:hypothetical protein
MDESDVFLQNIGEIARLVISWLRRGRSGQKEDVILVGVVMDLSRKRPASMLLASTKVFINPWAKMVDDVERWPTKTSSYEASTCATSRRKVGKLNFY